MGLFYTFKADGEEKLLSTYVADPSDRYALQWLYEDFAWWIGSRSRC